MEPGERSHERYTLKFWHMYFVSAADLAEAICTMQGVQNGAVLLEQERRLIEHFGDPVAQLYVREILTTVRKLARNQTELLGAQLGARITEAREAAGLTLSELASQAGLRRKVLERIEETGHVSKPIVLERLARALKTTPDTLQPPPIEE